MQLPPTIVGYLLLWRSAIGLVNSPSFDATVYNSSSGVKASSGIVNGSFETGTLSFWLGQWNVNLVGVEKNHPSSGTYDAYLHPTSTLDCAIYQNYPANITGLYTLSAQADTSISNLVQLGVDVQGVQAAKTIIATGRYQTYTLNFTAAIGSLVKVWFYSASANGTYPNGPWATLDNVQITSIIPGSFGILNGGFETGTLNPWLGQWHPNLVGIETNHPSSGSFNAYLHPTSTQDCANYQDFNANTSRTYTLSARADTSIPSLFQLGADVRGVQANKTIIATGGYQTYTITFTAAAGDLIKAWFYSAVTGQSNAWATLDNVQVV